MTNAQLDRIAALQASGKACLRCGGFGFTADAHDFTTAPCPKCGGTGIAPKPRCPVCQLEDGSPNVTLLHAEGSCGFGCPSRIPWNEGGAGFCPTCKDHSANYYECEACSRHWSDWSEGVWEEEVQ